MLFILRLIYYITETDVISTEAKRNGEMTMCVIVSRTSALRRTRIPA